VTLEITVYQKAILMLKFASEEETTNRSQTFGWI